MRDKIFILGYYGWNNTGDDAMLYSLLQNLNDLYANSEFSVLSRSSVLIPSSLTNNVKFISNSKPIKVFWEIMHSSMFILGGGTHLYDYGNKKNRIARLSQMLIILVFAKVCSLKVYLLGIGVESPSTGWGKLLIKNICLLADKISVRDSLSYNALNELGVKDNLITSFDLATLLDCSSSRNVNTVLKENKILGVSILPFFEIYYADKEKDKLFLSNIAEGLNQWLKNDPKSMLRLFTFKGKSKDDDVLITSMLQELLEPSERVKLIEYDPNPVETLHKIAECHAFVGMRYHSCLFAYLAEIPLLIIDYAEKNQALAKDIGLAKNAIISLESILKGDFAATLTSMQKNPHQFIAALPKETAINIAKKGFLETLK